MGKILPVLLALACMFILTAAADDLEPTWVARSVVDAGDFSRLHSAMAKATRGEAITIAAIGGSITAGAAASAEEHRRANCAAAWWRAKYPNVEVRFINAGIGATGSNIGAHRIRQDVLVARPDVVMLEFDLAGTAIGLAFKKQETGYGRASIAVDGGVSQILDGYSPQDWGGGYTPFVTAGHDLPAGKHRLSVTVLDERAAESPGNAFELHAIYSARLPYAPMQWTQPLMRGTLWWLAPADPEVWTEARLAEAIDAQRAAGFDLLWILNTPQLLEKAPSILDTLYTLADARGMKVIADLPRGGWHGETPAETLGKTLAEYAARFAARYGTHASFYGWYLNHEINPIAPDNAEESAYWRTVWKMAVAGCHTAKAGSVVTISPFFLLDAARRMGFVYLTPEQYGGWWCETLRETGIDILMLQDSGEHLSFFTLEQREPFWAATAAACRAAGKQFWLNVETGEAIAADWDDYTRQYWAKSLQWRFTRMEWLQQKLVRAACYADGIVNWGYFPYMDPHPLPGKELPGQKEAYEAYVEYSKQSARPRH